MFTCLSTNFALKNQDFCELFFSNLLRESKIKIIRNKQK